jgi:hypothetical protein
MMWRYSGSQTVPIIYPLTKFSLGATTLGICTGTVQLYLII